MHEFKNVPDWLSGYEKEVEDELRKPALKHPEVPGEHSESLDNISSIRSGIETLRAELRALIHLGGGTGSKEMLAGLPKVADELRHLMEQLNEINNHLQNDALQIETQNEKLSESQAAFQGQLTDLRAKVGMAQEGYETRIRALQEQIKALQDQKKILEANTMIQSSRIERLEEELQRSHAEKMSAERKHLESQSRLLELEGIRSTLSNQIASLQGALDELRRLR